MGFAFTAVSALLIIHPATALLLVAGEVGWGHLLLVLKLMPGIALDMWLSGYAIRYLTKGGRDPRCCASWPPRRSLP